MPTIMQPPRGAQPPWALFHSAGLGNEWDLFVWVTEKQICDLIQNHRLLELRHAGPKRDFFRVFREEEIGHGLRPDFMIYCRFFKMKIIRAVEVKITADAASVCQLANYVRVLQRHAESLKLSGTNISGQLIAKNFDKSVYSAADILGFGLRRFSLKNNEPRLDHEENIFNHYGTDAAMLETLSKMYANARPERRKTQASDHAESKC